MTALQWIVKEAKSIKKKYPKRFSKWTEYVAQASAIYASKHKGKSPVGKKKAAKKRKVAGVKASKEIKKTLAKKGLKMPHGYSTTKRVRKVGAVKKKKISEQSILNRIHRVKDDVSKLDELQHKHMMGRYIGSMNPNEINKGDILVCSWGYDQTNIDFYYVIKKTGLNVTIIPMSNKIVTYDSHYMTGTVIPNEPNYNAKPMRRKIQKSSISNSLWIKINSFSSASKWTGKPQHFSNYA